MENIKIAKICGLCAGCKYAIKIATDELKNNNVTILKEIVHNQNVNNSLFNLGIKIANNADEIDKNSTAIIRAHGEPPETFDFLEKHNIKFIDGTCINVKKIHKRIADESDFGKIIVLVGNYGKKTGKMHPEIFGSIGYCKNEPILIEDEEDVVEKLTSLKNKNLFVISQTTFGPDKFNLICNQILKTCEKDNNIEIENSICNAQKLILKSSLELCKNSDLMIVVGGKNSHNSTELFNLLKKFKPAIFIENINDWQSELEKINYKLTPEIKIGITAGASTDRNELEILKNKIENYLK